MEKENSPDLSKISVDKSEKMKSPQSNIKINKTNNKEEKKRYKNHHVNQLKQQESESENNLLLNPKMDIQK